MQFQLNAPFSSQSYTTSPSLSIADCSTIPTKRTWTINPGTNSSWRSWKTEHRQTLIVFRTERVTFMDLAATQWPPPNDKEQPQSARGRPPPAGEEEPFQRRRTQNNSSGDHHHQHADDRQGRKIIITQLWSTAKKCSEVKWGSWNV